MITASDALNSFREKIRVRLTREGNPVIAVALVREAVGKYPSLGGRGETMVNSKIMAVLNSICILFLRHPCTIHHSPHVIVGLTQPSWSWPPKLPKHAHRYDLVWPQRNLHRRILDRKLL